ncbi:MAG: hypothetical protein ABIQ13_08190 [Pedococcus sp.]
MMGSSEDVRAVARQVRRDAELVRHVAARVGATRGMAWRSAAATRFREVVGDRVAGLGRMVGGLDAAAETLEAHALALDRAKETLRHLVGEVPGIGGRR